MSKLNKFQEKRRIMRNVRVLELAKEGYRYRQIAEKIKDEYMDSLTTQSIYKIIRQQLEGEK